MFLMLALHLAFSFCKYMASEQTIARMIIFFHYFPLAFIRKVLNVDEKVNFKHTNNNYYYNNNSNKNMPLIIISIIVIIIVIIIIIIIIIVKDESMKRKTNNERMDVRLDRKIDRGMTE